MKRRKTNWDHVPWTPFERASYPDLPEEAQPDAVLMNSRYQVSIWAIEHPVFGECVHLSIKTHDRQPRHDWRDMQRIKNEICGPEWEGMELFPAESRLVDTANQYHLFVFRASPFGGIGFDERLVGGEGPTLGRSRQRPFDADARPSDAVSGRELDARARRQFTWLG